MMKKLGKKDIKELQKQLPKLPKKIGDKRND